jgi:transposase
VFYKDEKTCGKVVKMLIDVKSILGLPEEMEVVDGEVTEKTITIVAVSTQMAPCCPLCGTSASRIHSSYSRHLMDVPCAQKCVRLILQVRKFFCDLKTCARKIFTERLSPFIQPWARVTTRLFQEVENIGLATSGMLGTRLGDRLGIRTSWMTIIRRMMAQPASPVERVIQLGIDDFSLRRGRKFGTILVDLQSHEIIDLLPDRKAKTASDWMGAHPEIDLVSRDRGKEYASATASGAPQATQCLDRFHLLKNLREDLEGFLARHLAVKHREKPQEAPDMPSALARQATRTRRLSPKVEQAQQNRREERLARYQQVIALRKQGMSHEAIALRVGMGASTVQRWLAADAFPERKPREQGSHVDWYLPYLKKRWEEGCHNMTKLFQELVQQGYKGSYASVRDKMIRLLPQGRKKPLGSSLKIPALPTSQEASFLFIHRPEALETEEQDLLARILRLHPEVDLAYKLVQQFARMLRTRTGEQLDTWLAQVTDSHIPELLSFAKGIEQEKSAVVAGLTLKWSNGLVEGKVNKLKLIKRMGYGRAGFPLLRQRVLHAL